MKVLQVIDTLHIGGAEKVMVTLTNLLWQKLIATDVLLLRQKGPLVNNITTEAKIIVLDRRQKFSFSKLLEAHNICKQYDVVHVHMRHCYAYIRLAQLIFSGKYKLVFHDHFGDININAEVPFGLKGIFKPKYYIGVSPALTNWALNKLGIQKQHVFLLLNSVESKCRQVDIKQGTNGIMLVSNIRPTKNIEFAIELIAGTGWQLTIYGNKEEQKYYEIIKAMANDSNVKIIEGKSNLADEYKEHDMALHCSKSETGPLVLLEYMADGMPFLAYKTGAVAEVAADQLSLYFIDNFQPEEWRKRIGMILAKKTHTELKEVFEQYFSTETYINNCLRIYRKINC